jgi:hypothetical protein
MPAAMTAGLLIDAPPPRLPHHARAMPVEFSPKSDGLRLNVAKFAERRASNGGKNEDA